MQATINGFRMIYQVEGPDAAAPWSCTIRSPPI
jgi:hypothetical protein